MWNCSPCFIAFGLRNNIIKPMLICFCCVINIEDEIRFKNNKRIIEAFEKSSYVDGS